MVYQRGTHNTKVGTYLECDLNYRDNCASTQTTANGMKKKEREGIVAVKGKGVMRGDARRGPYL